MTALTMQDCRAYNYLSLDFQALDKIMRLKDM